MVLSHQSGRLHEVPKLGAAKIRQIRESWHQNETMRENMIFGQTYGISIIKMTKIVRKYGPDAVAIVKADPYRLCRDIWGIGFATADKIALSVGIPKDSPLRARASISYTLETEAEEGGHCWTFENDLLLHANELTGIPTEVLSSALAEEIESGRVVVESSREEVTDPNPTLKDSNLPRKVYLKSLYFSERDVARRVKAILEAPRGFAAFDAEKAIAWDSSLRRSSLRRWRIRSSLSSPSSRADRALVRPPLSGRWSRSMRRSSEFKAQSSRLSWRRRRDVRRSG